MTMERPYLGFALASATCVLIGATLLVWRTQGDQAENLRHLKCLDELTAYAAHDIKIAPGYETRCVGITYEEANQILVRYGKPPLN